MDRKRMRGMMEAFLHMLSFQLILIWIVFYFWMDGRFQNESFDKYDIGKMNLVLFLCTLTFRWSWKFNHFFDIENKDQTHIFFMKISTFNISVQKYIHELFMFLEKSFLYVRNKIYLITTGYSSILHRFYTFVFFTWFIYIHDTFWKIYIKYQKNIMKIFNIDCILALSTRN